MSASLLPTACSCAAFKYLIAICRNEVHTCLVCQLVLEPLFQCGTFSLYTHLSCQWEGEGAIATAYCREGNALQPALIRQLQ
jgi:hypothetical protein